MSQRRPSGPASARRNVQAAPGQLRSLSKSNTWPSKQSQKEETSKSRSKKSTFIHISTLQWLSCMFLQRFHSNKLTKIMPTAGPSVLRPALSTRRAAHHGDPEAAKEGSVVHLLGLRNPNGTEQDFFWIKLILLFETSANTLLTIFAGTCLNFISTPRLGQGVLHAKDFA